MFWKKLHFGREFVVFSGSGDAVCGGRFRRKRNIWRMTAFVREEIGSDTPAAAWKKAVRSIGPAEFCAVTGKIEGASFFRFQSVEMDSKAQKGAVEFELQRNLLKVPESYSVQFCSSGEIAGEEGSVLVNVAVFPEKAMEEFSAVLSEAGVKADEYIHPFMAIDGEMDTLILPEIDAEFCYIKDSWMPMPDEEVCRANRGMWDEKFRKQFSLPTAAGFNIDDFRMLLLAAGFIISGKLHNSPDAFKVLPDNVRPVRFRGHIIVTVLLVLMLIGSLVWRFSVTYGKDIDEYRKITAETKKLKQKTSELNSSVKRSAKELKEMTRLVSMTVGEPDAVAEFALLSETLPKDVLVSSIRWGESDIDIVMQSEDAQLDITSLIQPLKYWKVGSLQQRQTGDSAVATITLKLIPYDAKVLK